MCRMQWIYIKVDLENEERLDSVYTTEIAIHLRIKDALLGITFRLFMAWCILRRVYIISLVYSNDPKRKGLANDTMCAVEKPEGEGGGAL